MARRPSLRALRPLAFVLLLLPCGGCQFLQNEFFVFDAAPPRPAAGLRCEDDLPGGTDAVWRELSADTRRRAGSRGRS